MNEFAKIKAHIKAKEEAQYQNELRNFRYKHPIATEEFYIKYRIRIIENLLVEYDKTADFTKSFDVEGIEIINGNPVCTKMGTATDYILLDTEVNLFKQRLINLSEPQIASEPTKEKNNAFYTGLKFATGEAQTHYKKATISFDKLTIDLGFEKKIRPYFSATINRNPSNKNLYNNSKVMIELYNYCINNKVVMCEEFLNKYSQIELE